MSLHPCLSTLNTKMLDDPTHPSVMCNGRDDELPHDTPYIRLVHPVDDVRHIIVDETSAIPACVTCPAESDPLLIETDTSTLFPASSAPLANWAYR